MTASGWTQLYFENTLPHSIMTCKEDDRASGDTEALERGEGDVGGSRVQDQQKSAAMADIDALSDAEEHDENDDEADLTM